MVNVHNLKVWIGLPDQPAIGQPFFIERESRERLERRLSATPDLQALYLDVETPHDPAPMCRLPCKLEPATYQSARSLMALSARF